MKHVVLPVLLAALIGLSGCGGSGDSLGREGVSGTITFEGKPLDQGTIEFVPNGPGTSSGAMITEGSYSIPDDKGLPAGEYTVRIYSPEGGAEDLGDAAPGESTVVAKERIAEEFNVNSTLKATVTEGGENKFDFDVTPK